MRKIPAALNAQFDALLVKNKIPQRFHSHYLKWLRYYLDFCQRYRFSEPNPRSLPNFIRKLKEKRQTNVQQKQAKEAIYICLWYTHIGLTSWGNGGQYRVL